MEKRITAILIMITIVTIIQNLIFAYKYFVTKEYDDIGDAGFLHFVCLYLFFCFAMIKGTILIYNYI